eukprot:5564741-Pyramimonas_sp.AAC.1
MRRTHLRASKVLSPRHLSLPLPRQGRGRLEEAPFDRIRREYGQVKTPRDLGTATRHRLTLRAIRVALDRGGGLAEGL